MTSRTTETDLRAPKVLTTFRHPIEAEHLANQLRDHDIEVIISGGPIATGTIEFVQIDVEVLVPAEQLKTARSLMQEFEANDSPIDWDAVDWQDGETPSATESELQVEDTIESSVSRLLYPEPSATLGNWFVVRLVVGLIAAAALIWLSSL